MDFFEKFPYAIFQLTRLMRGVTFLLQHIPVGMRISTHTPHARRDQVILCIK